jgi:pimeloyl-ACP methyl ester carboxylesterase
MFRRGVEPTSLQQRAATSTDTLVEAILRLPVDELGPPLLSPDELAVYVDAFRGGGFRGPVNWYRNFDRNWELTADQTDARIDGVPCLMVTAAWDPVLPPALASGMPDLIDDLEIHEVARCGHWTQQEHPDEFNRTLIYWLERHLGPSGW